LIGMENVGCKPALKRCGIQTVPLQPPVELVGLIRHDSSQPLVEQSGSGQGADGAQR